MPNWKKVIVSGSDAVLNSLDIITSLTASGLNYPTTDGTDGQVLLTDGSGELTFGDNVKYVTVKNVSSGTLTKGTPVHSTGTSGNTPEVIPASASLASTMPANFVLAQNISVGAEGRAVLSGFLNGVNTNGFDAGDVIYVAPTGSYTITKPEGDGNLIQNVAIVGSVGVNGSLFVYGSGRSNDVPNLPEGKIWVGDGYTITSSIVHLDETNSIAQFTGSISGDSKLTIGPSQTNSGTLSSIAGGRNNTISSNCNFIGGGCQNSITSFSSFLGGGCLNSVDARRSGIVGGSSNRICYGSWQFIGGGCANTGSGGFAVIAGGQGNILGSSTDTCPGDNSIIGGGQENSIYTNWSSIVGGCKNIIEGTRGFGVGIIPLYSFIGGGARNHISSSAISSSIVGGFDNTSDFANTHIIGSGLTADKADYTFVNNLDVEGTVSASIFSGSFVGDGSGLTGISAGATDINGLSDGYTEGLGNVFLGTPTASLSITSGTRNTVLGCNAGKGITSGLGSTIMGYCTAPSLNSTVTAIGYETLCSATGGSFMTLIGYQAGRNITSANYTTGLGYQTLFCNLTGQRNTALGYQAGFGATGGSNTFIGNCSGGTSTSYSSNNNTAVGTYSLKCGGGSQNTALGMGALCTNTSGLSNVVIGHNAGTNLTGGTLNIIIGQGAQASSATALYEITLGSSQNVVRIPGLNASEGDVLAYCSTAGLQSQGGFIASSAISSSFTTGSNVYGPYGANSILSASFAISSSHTEFADTTNNAISASYASSASHAEYADSAFSAISASYAVSSSHEIIQEISSSYAETATSASYALTASYAATASIAIGGSNTQVQFNDNGDLGASPNLTFDGSTLSVTGAVEGSTTLTIGSSQTNSGTLSSIGGGTSNTLAGNCGFIGAGVSNVICSNENYGFIGGGASNKIDADYSSVVGGHSNCLTLSGNCGFIGGGCLNCISRIFSTIGGGFSNSNSADYGYGIIGDNSRWCQ
jgi:hypothetical protein